MAAPVPYSREHAKSNMPEDERNIQQRGVASVFLAAAI